MTFGEIVRDARKRKNWSLRKLAEEMTNAGAVISFTYLSRVENDAPEYPLKEEKITIMANLLGIDAQKLIIAAKKFPEEILQEMTTNEEFADQVLSYYRTFKKS